MDRDKQAFNKCHVVLHNSLNLQVITPSLLKEGLITQEDDGKLNNHDTIDYEKIEYLIKILPDRKQDDWLDKFLKCLNETCKGTGHCKVVREIENARQWQELGGVVEETRNGTSDEVDFAICINSEGYQSSTGQEAAKGFYNAESKAHSSGTESDKNKRVWSSPNSRIRSKSDSVQLAAQTEARKQLNFILTSEELKRHYDFFFSGKIQKKQKDDIGDLKNSKYKVLIQTVNDNEFYAVMLELKNRKATRYIGYEIVCHSYSYYYVGEWGKVPVVIIQTGMSNNGVNCSWYETKKALHFLPHLEYIFSVGVCGGVKGKVKLDNVVLSKAIHGYTDLKITQFDWRNRSVHSLCSQTSLFHNITRAAVISSNQFVVKPGAILSGPWLIADSKSQCDLLKLAPEAIAFEMEGANIVQACGQTPVECFVVKGVSDLADENKCDDWQPQAATNAANYLHKALNDSLHILKLEEGLK